MPLRQLEFFFGPLALGNVGKIDANKPDIRKVVKRLVEDRSIGFDLACEDVPSGLRSDCSNDFRPSIEDRMFGTDFRNVGKTSARRLDWRR